MQKTTGMISRLGASRSLNSPRRASAILIAALSYVFFVWPAYGDTVSFVDPGLTVSQGGCVSVEGGNCAETLPNSGTYYSPTGATSASISPPAATASASGSGFYNSASANATGSFNTTTSATGGTLSATGFITANAIQSCVFNGAPCIVNADGSGNSVFSTSVTISSPTYYSLNFSGPGTSSMGSTSETTAFSSNIGPGYSEASGTISISGQLAAGTYYLQGLVAGDASTCAGCYSAVTDEYNLSLTLSSTPIPPAVPLPAAAWLMLSGLGGLVAFARRKGAA